MTDFRHLQHSAVNRLTQTGVLCLLLTTPGFGADSHAVRVAQTNRCAIYGSGFVTSTDGGCARIGGRVRVTRRQDARLPVAPSPAPIGTPVANGFHFSSDRDGPSRAHLRLPNETGSFAPSFR